MTVIRLADYRPRQAPPPTPQPTTPFECLLAGYRLGLRTVELALLAWVELIRRHSP
jgi:hypothetical protein